MIVVSHKDTVDHGLDLRIKSHHRLGCAFLEGQGVKQSLIQAEKHYRFAAVRGHVHAKLNLRRVLQAKRELGANATNIPVATAVVAPPPSVRPPAPDIPVVQIVQRSIPACAAAPGTRWRIRGLVKNSQLNGNVVMLCEHHGKSGKAIVEVVLYNSKTTKCKIKYANLVPLEEGEDDESF